MSALHTNSATLIREAAVDFIGRQRRDTPFFLYLPFQNVHKPYTCQGTFRARYKNVPTLTEAERTLFGYISELDEAVVERSDVLVADRPVRRRRREPAALWQQV